MRKLARAAQLFISALNMGAHDLHFASIKLSWRIQNCGGQERLAIIMKQRGNANKAQFFVLKPQILPKGH